MLVAKRLGELKKQRPRDSKAGMEEFAEVYGKALSVGPIPSY